MRLAAVEGCLRTLTADADVPAKSGEGRGVAEDEPELKKKQRGRFPDAVESGTRTWSRGS